MTADSPVVIRAIPDDSTDSPRLPGRLQAPIRLPRPRGAGGAVPAEGQALGPPDAPDQVGSRLERDCGVYRDGRQGRRAGDEAELIGDAPAGEGVHPHQREPRLQALRALETLRPAWSDGICQAGSISGPEMSQTGRTVPGMNEPLSRYKVTVTVGCHGGSCPDPAAFAVAANQAAWSRSASILSAHLADKIISVVTVTAPDLYAAVAVARAVVSDALKRQALSSSQSADDRAHRRAEVRTMPCA
jgi:hypothetical protein